MKLSFTHLIKTAGYLLPPNTNPYPLSRFIFLHSSSHHLIHYTFFTNFATVWKLHKNKDPCAVPPAPERVLCHTAKRSRLQRSGWRNGNLREETGESRKSFWRSKSPRHSPTATPKYRPESVGASPSLSRHAHLGGAMAGSSATGGSRGRAGGLGPPPDLPRAHAPPTRKWVKGRRRRRRGWSSGAERAGKPQALWRTDWPWQTRWSPLARSRTCWPAALEACAWCSWDTRWTLSRCEEAGARGLEGGGPTEQGAESRVSRDARSGTEVGPGGASVRSLGNLPLDPFGCGGNCSCAPRS